MVKEGASAEFEKLVEIVFLHLAAPLLKGGSYLYGFEAVAVAEVAAPEVTTEHAGADAVVNFGVAEAMRDKFVRGGC